MEKSPRRKVVRPWPDRRHKRRHAHLASVLRVAVRHALGPTLEGVQVRSVLPDIPAARTRGSGERTSSRRRVYAELKQRPSPKESVRNNTLLTLLAGLLQRTLILNLQRAPNSNEYHRDHVSVRCVWPFIIYTVAGNDSDGHKNYRFYC